MPKDKTNLAILTVLLAGIFWSFGALVVRYIEDARSVPWQYLFFRGLTIFVILNLYLFLKEGKSFTKNYKKVDLSVVIGGMGFATAFMGFIWSITHTSVAITLLMLAAMPFITAILGYIFLKEKVSFTTLTAIIIAAVGVIFMAYSSNKLGTLFGLMLGLIISFRFFNWFGYFEME